MRNRMPHSRKASNSSLTDTFAAIGCTVASSAWAMKLADAAGPGGTASVCSGSGGVRSGPAGASRVRNRAGGRRARHAEDSMGTSTGPSIALHRHRPSADWWGAGRCPPPGAAGWSGGGQPRRVMGPSHLECAISPAAVRWPASRRSPRSSPTPRTPTSAVFRAGADGLRRAVRRRYSHAPRRRPLRIGTTCRPVASPIRQPHAGAATAAVAGEDPSHIRCAQRRVAEARWSLCSTH